MKMKERRKEQLSRKKFCSERKDFIRLYQKSGRTDVDELRIIDSSNNEGTKRIRQERIAHRVYSHTTSTIKLALAGI